MTNRKFSRKRVVQALGLLMLGLALLVVSAGYGQSGNSPLKFVKAKTDASGRLAVQLWPPSASQPQSVSLLQSAATQLWLIIDFVVDRPKKAERPDDKLLRFAEVLVGYPLDPIPRILQQEEPRPEIPVETCYSTRGLTALSISYVFTLCRLDPKEYQDPNKPSPENAGLQKPEDRMLFAGLKKFKVETSGSVMVFKSPLTDHPAVRQNVLYMTDLVVHDLKLKVGETFTLAPDALPKLKEVSNPLRNPEIRLNTKPEVAEAKVIQKEGEVFGAIEFTAKAKGETMILIDYDLFSQIAQVVLSQARLQVNVKVE